MNRHQSNPFLAGWDEDEDTRAQTLDGLDKSQIDWNYDDTKPAEAPSRRYSSSQADVSGNPFGAQRSADRRLYHRNMSSFEAASLQLEQHQKQLEEIGSDRGNDSDLIAKMTAEFKSAIETNDKHFDGDHQNPTFDPFETITDDDVSLPSPAPSLGPTSQQLDDKVPPNNPPAANCVDRPASIELATEKKKGHESIDDDDDELISTPVRNIKSLDQINGSMDNTKAENIDQATRAKDSDGGEEPTDGKIAADSQGANSIEKASMFASLLASAESTGPQAASGSSKPSEPLDGTRTGVEMPIVVEEATRIITGSPSRDGNSVGFFDPFETVIDKDALTSLMNDQQSSGRQKTEDQEGERAIDESNLSLDSASNHRIGLIAESTSVETVIENSNSPNNGPSEEQVAEHQTTGENEPTEVASRPSQREASRQANKTKSNKSKKKSSFQEDSSDSCDDDDRLQIVIKARNVSKADESSAKPIIVPLLPPPPSKSSMKQARERGQVEDMPSPVMSYKQRSSGQKVNRDSFDDSADESRDDSKNNRASGLDADQMAQKKASEAISADMDDDDDDDENQDDQFVIPMNCSDDEGAESGKIETPLYDEDTSYVLEDYPAKYEGPGWEMLLRYPPKKGLTVNRFWKKIFVRLAEVPVPPSPAAKHHQSAKQQDGGSESAPKTCIVLQVFDKPEDKKPMQEIPIQASYTVSEISTQQFDQFGKIFTIKLQYIFYKERVGVRQGQLARLMPGHIGSSTTSGGHGVDPISIGAIKRAGAPIEHSPQISQIIKLGCSSYTGIRSFKYCLEDHLFKIPIGRDKALLTYRTEEVQMAVRDETYIELNQVGTILKQLARVRLFFLSFLNGTPTVEVGINDIHRQGKEVVGRMDILPVVTEEWIRLEAWELHPAIEKEAFEDPDLRMIRLVPPDGTFFELMRFRVRPPRNRELPLQISADMSVSRTKVAINCEVMVPGDVSRKHGQIPCEDIAIRIHIPECWIYFFREEKHFRMGSKKSVNRRPGKVKGIERFLGGGGGLQDVNDDSALIEVTSGQAKYEHHHHAIVWRAARWPKESQSAYVQNTMKIRLPLTAYDKMPDSYYEFVHVEYTMPATTVSHTTLRSISVNPCDDEPPEKYVKYSAKYEYKVKMRLSINISSNKTGASSQPEASPIVIMKQPDLHGDLHREEDSDDDDDDDDDDSDLDGQKKKN